MTDERVDSDVTLGEVNRNVNRIEKAFTTALEQLVTRREFEALERRVGILDEKKATREELTDVQGDVNDIRESGKSRLASWLAVAGIIVPSLLLIWQTLRGGA